MRPAAACYAARRGDPTHLVSQTTARTASVKSVCRLSTGLSRYPSPMSSRSRGLPELEDSRSMDPAPPGLRRHLTRATRVSFKIPIVSPSPRQNVHSCRLGARPAPCQACPLAPAPTAANRNGLTGTAQSGPGMLSTAACPPVRLCIAPTATISRPSHHLGSLGVPVTPYSKEGHHHRPHAPF